MDRVNSRPQHTNTNMLAKATYDIPGLGTMRQTCIFNIYYLSFKSLEIILDRSRRSCHSFSTFNTVSVLVQILMPSFK